MTEFYAGSLKTDMEVWFGHECGKNSHWKAGGKKIQTGLTHGKEKRMARKRYKSILNSIHLVKEINMNKNPCEYGADDGGP